MSLSFNRNRLLTLRVIEEDQIKIPKTVVSEILIQDLRMNHVAEKFYPWLLTDKSKNYRMET